MKIKKIYLVALPLLTIILSLILLNSGNIKLIYAQSNTSWLHGYLGSISANGGIKITMPNLPNYTIPFTTITGIPYFTTYSTISGTADIPLTQQSKYKEYTTNYINAATKPPLESGFTSWHDFIEIQVKKNKKTEVKDLTTSQTISGNLSINHKIAIGSKIIYDIVGDLTVNSGTVCDIEVMYLVTGNITINPDLTNTADNGCIFVAKGNVTIGVGTQKTDQLKASVTPISYDIINAAIIADGTFVTPVDNGVGSTKKWDGLYINGSVTAITLDLHREPNSSDNAQPGHIFVYDPRYKESFKDDMSFRYYSIREKTN